MSPYYFCEGEGSRVDVSGPATESLGHKLDAEMICSVDAT